MYKIMAKWNDLDTRLLIKKYKEYPVLWKKDVPGYGKRGPREMAWNKLAAEFHGKTKNDMAAKVRVLRGMYLRRRKQKAMKKNGSEAFAPNDEEDDDRDDKMEWLDELSFLDNYVSHSRSLSNLESPNVSDEDGEEQEESQPMNEAADMSYTLNYKDLQLGESSDHGNDSVQSKHKRHDGKQASATKREYAICRRDEENVMVISIPFAKSGQTASSDVSNKPCDPCDLFGQCVANELRSITDDFTRDQAKLEINSVLFRAKWNLTGDAGLHNT